MECFFKSIFFLYVGIIVSLLAGLDGLKKIRPTGIRSPDRPARSQSLYRQSYPAHIPYCCRFPTVMRNFFGRTITSPTSTTNERQFPQWDLILQQLSGFGLRRCAHRDWKILVMLLNCDPELLIGKILKVYKKNILK